MQIASRPVVRSSAAPAASSLRKRAVVGPAASPLERTLLTAPTHGNKISFHVTAKSALQAILQSIKNARDSFLIETFIWHDDDAGRQIAQALVDKKEAAKAEGRTFDVKVLLDWIGHKTGAIKSDDENIVKFMRDHDIEVRLFADGLIDAGRVTPITHRKLYIADGDRFISGGRNLGDEYLSDGYKVPGGESDNAWHDLAYTVEGAETGRVLAEFYKNWTRAGGEAPLSMPRVNPTGGGAARVQSVTTDPHARTYGLRDAHTRAIRNARKEIVAIYPYFSDDTFIAELIAAKQARPDLRVRVMMPEAEEPVGGAIYYSLNRETARQLEAAGIEVRFFGGELKDGAVVPRYSHMKAMVIDGEILSIGSANADARTFKNNHELNTLIADRATAQDFMRRVVEPDWEAAGLSRPQEAPGFLERLKRRVLEWIDFLL